MIGYADLSATQLAALVAVNFAPIVRCSDGLWRALGHFVPAAGVDEDDIHFLWSEGLIEWAPKGAIVTESGRSVLQASQWLSSAAMTPAKRGTQSAPSLVQ